MQETFSSKFEAQNGENSSKNNNFTKVQENWQQKTFFIDFYQETFTQQMINQKVFL